MANQAAGADHASAAAGRCNSSSPSRQNRFVDDVHGDGNAFFDLLFLDTRLHGGLVYRQLTVVLLFVHHASGANELGHGDLRCHESAK